MHDTVRRLLEKKTVILDGAWGTQMQAHGLPVGGSPESWNLEQPDKVEAVARAYVEAGSDIILTNSFGGSRIMLDRHGLADRTAEINKAAAACSVRAAGDRCLVFGSIGPTGKMVMMGDITPEALTDTFREQAAALAEGGVHGLVVETMADLDELKAAVAAAKETGLPVAACMVYDTGPGKDRTMMGVAPEQAVEAMLEVDADILGSNCGQGIEGFLPICERYRQASDRPLWMKPNAGLPRMEGGTAVYDTKPEEFAEAALGLLDAGASFIGGCCGTSPDFVRALRNTLIG